MEETVIESMDLQYLLENVKRNLPQLHQDCLALSELLNLTQSPSKEAWSIIGELVHKLDVLYRKIRMIHDELASLPDNDELMFHLGDFIRKFFEQFQMMNRFMDQEDYRDAADCFKYELGESIRVLSFVLGDEIEAMDARFQKNLSYLQEKFPEVYASLADKTPDWANYQIVFAKSGMPNLRVKTEDGRWMKLYSSYDPEAEVAQWISRVVRGLDQTSDLILYGLGFGYHLLMLGLHAPDLRFSVYEPDEQIFLMALHAVDLESLFEKVNLEDLVVGRDSARRRQMVLKRVANATAHVTVLGFPAYERLSRADLIAFGEEAKTVVMARRSSIDSYAKFGMQWLRNRLFNLAKILNTPSLKNYKEMLSGQTAVVVGAGPSLEEDIPALKELRNHALIIAAGSAIQSLLHFGIEPHLLVYVDGGDINLKIYKDPRIRRIPMLFAPMAHHKIIENHDVDRLIHFYLEEDYTTQFLTEMRADDPYFRVVPTVSGIAVEAAIYMGCNEVVLVGQDLSYPENRIYAEGAQHVTEKGIRGKLELAVYEVENVAGGINRTTHGMLVTLRKMEELLKLYPDVLFINTARHGAKIAHTNWEPIEQVLRRLRGKEAPAGVIERFLGDPQALYGSERQKIAVARLSMLPLQLNEVETRINKITDLLNQLPELSHARSDLCIRFMQDVETEWGQIIESPVFSVLMTTVLVKEIQAFDRDRPELEKETLVERKAELFVKILEPMVQAMQSCIPRLKEMVKTGYERLEAAGFVH